MPTRQQFLHIGAVSQFQGTFIDRIAFKAKSFVKLGGSDVLKAHVQRYVFDWRVRQRDRRLD